MTPARLRALVAAPVAAALLAAGGCAVGTPAPSPVPDPTVVPSAPPAAPAPAPPAGPPAAAFEPVTFAFAGDVHAEGVAGRVVEDGLGRVADLFDQHDVVVANLETAVLSDPAAAAPAPKTYTFAAPPALLDTLAAEGVDVVTLANNHGMDHGGEGLRQTLAAADASPLGLVGAGADADAAYAPWTTQVRGTRVAVLAATDVLDSFAIGTWPATAEAPGLASSKGARQARLVRAVRDAAAGADVVAVYLHWGVERETCATERQRALARRVVAAGADVVVGSHAHVVQHAGRVDDAVVHYGLGNFVWYADETSPSARTGVLSVEVGPDGSTASWHGARIRAGLPQLTGEAGPPADGC